MTDRIVFASYRFDRLLKSTKALDVYMRVSGQNVVQLGRFLRHIAILLWKKPLSFSC